jgi:hypothetical protein
MRAKLLSIIMLAITTLLGVGVARADSITFGGTGSDSDGPLSATIKFTAVAGGIQIVVTNTETGTIGQGQGVSGFGFSVGGGLGTPTGFTSLSGEQWTNNSGGTAWTLASGTAFTDSGSGTIDNWAFCNGSGVSLSVAGGCSSGQPQFLIFPSTGTAGPGNSLVTHCQPCLIGPTTFFLADPGVTASTVLTGKISDVDLSFGTGPDFVDDTTPLPPVPETSSLISLGSGLLALGLVAFFLRQRPVLTSA